ncbi:tail completion protein gp17 [Paenibacillus caseinilyticus]|uniref:DUF3168 domain-containing protein n=1 Tax=Paenibacillus mucilaginosus K02 TaxID=997761 RepID=I0BIR7_9BACL|nr:DUF3168 domain-containing protein [Paenibacillus mucilaginosus]AFH62264.1 hypothetical protein B2K_16310 [Paenibacillus mucilaginosus K02]
MINVKPEVLEALREDEELLLLLGGPRVYQMVAPEPGKFPRITFFEISNVDDGYADDSVISSQIVIQVDVWNKTNTSAIADRVDAVMKNIGFSRSGSADLYENDTGIFHKAMRYTTRREEV